MQRTFTILLAVFFVLRELAGTPVVAQVPPLEAGLTVLLTDSFAKNSLDQYESDGDVSWADGRLTFLPGSFIRRDIDAERHMRVTLDVDWLDGPANINQDRESWLTCGFALRNGSNLWLRLSRQRKWLTVEEGLRNSAPEGLVTNTWSVQVTRSVQGKSEGDKEAKWVSKQLGYTQLEIAGEGTGQWTFTLQHGLARLSRDDTVVMRRYVSEATSDIHRVMVWTEKDRTALRDLRVVGVRPVQPGILQEASVARRSELGTQISALSRQKQYAQAIPLRRESLTLTELTYGLDNYRVAGELQNLSLLYYQAGDQANDRKTSQNRLEVCKRIYGDDHPQIASALSDLAYTWNKSGEQRSEEAALRRAAEIRRQTLGKDNDQYREVQRRLRSVLTKVAQQAESRDDFDAARHCRQEIIDIATEEKGRLYWSTVDARVALNDLTRRQLLSGEQRHQLRWAEQSEAEADGYSSEKKYDQAIAARERALNVRRELLGEHHRAYARSLTLLSVLYSRKHQFARGELLSRKSLEVYTALFGEDHPDVVTAHTNLGYFYSELEDHQRAVTSRRRAVEASRRVYGTDDQHYLNNRNDLATSLAALREELIRTGRYGEARKVIRELVEIDEQRFAELAWRRFDSRWQLTRVDQWEQLTPDERQRLAEAQKTADQEEARWQSDSARAIESCTKAVELTAALLGMGGRDHRDRVVRLASLYSRLERYEDAARLLRDVVTYDAALFAELDGQHPRRAHAVNDLGLALEKSGQLNESIAALRESVDLFRKTEGAGSRSAEVVSGNCRRVLDLLASQAELAGEFQQAESLAGEILERATRVYGDTHWQCEYPRHRLQLAQRLISAEPQLQTKYIDAARLFREGKDQHNDDRYADAVKTLTACLTGLSEVLGQDHWLCASVLQILGDTEDAVGDSAAALEHYSVAYGIKTALLSENHPDIASIAERLGLLLASLRRGDEARPILERVLAIRQQHDDAENSLVTWSRDLLEDVQRAVQNGDESAWPKTFVVYQMEGRADRLRRQAAAFVKAGDAENAAACQQRLANVEQRRLGPGHPSVAEILSEVAASRLASADLATAIDAAQDAVAYCETQYGPQHWRTRSVRIQLRELKQFAALPDDSRQRLADASASVNEATATSLTTEAHRDTAIAALEAAIAVRTEVLDRPDSGLLALQLKLARLRSEAATATPDVVQTEFERILTQREALYGREHPAVAEVQTIIGEWLRDRGEFTTARDRFQQVVAQSNAAYGAESLETAAAQFDLAGVLLDLGDLEQAEDISLQSAKIRNPRLSGLGPVMARALGQLADIRLARGLLPAASGAAERAVQLWNDEPDDSRDRANALSCFGIVMAQQQRFDEARPLLNQSLEMLQRLGAPESSDQARAHYGVGLYHAGRNEPEQALRHLHEARRLTLQLDSGHWLRRRVAFGFQDTATAAAREALAHNRLGEADSLFTELTAVTRELYPEVEWRQRLVAVELDLIASKRKLSADQLARLGNATDVLDEATGLFKAGDRKAGLARAEVVLQDYQQLLGSQCRETAIVTFGLAMMKSTDGADDEAERLYQQALSIMAEVTGRSDPQYASLLQTLGGLYAARQQWERAEKAYRQVLEIWLTVPDIDAPMLAETRAELANVLSARARAAEGERDFETAFRRATEAVSLLVEAHGEQNWRTIDARRHQVTLQMIRQFDEADRERLAEAERLKSKMAELRKASQSREALPLAAQRLAILHDLFGVGHPLATEQQIETGRLHMDLQEWSQARDLFSSASAVLKLQVGEDHPLVATCMSLLSTALLRRDGPQTALPLAERALAIRRQQLGADHFDTHTALNNLALVQEESGDLTAAQASYEEAIAGRTRTLGPRAVSLATPLMNLGMLQSRQGNYGEALSLLQQALFLRRENEGDDDADTTSCMRLLAGVHRNVNDLDTAQNLLQQALEAEQRVLGEDHAGTAATHRELGRVYREQGKSDLARTHLKQSLAARERLYGESSAEVASGWGDLAELARVSGDHDRAKELAAKAVDILRRAVGDEHAELANLISGRAYQYQVTSDYDTARKYYLEALAIDRQVWDAKHPRLVERLSQLGRNFESMGFPSESRDLFEEALAITRETHAGDSRELADVLSDYGWSLYLMGDYRTSRLHLEESLAINRRVRGNADRNTALVCQRLALALDIVGDRDGYRAYSHESLEVAENVWGPDHLQLVTYLNNLASGFEQDDPERTRLYERGLKILQTPADAGGDASGRRLDLAKQFQLLGRYDDALRLYGQELEERRTKHGESGEHVAWVLRRMAEVHRRQNHHAEARDLFAQAQELLDKDFGRQTVVSSDNRIDLAMEYLALQDTETGLALVETGLDDLRSVWGTDDLRLARQLISTTFDLLRFGQAETAVRCARESLRIRETVLDPQHAETTRSRIALGQALGNAGEYDEAWTTMLSGARAMARQVSHGLAAESEHHHGQLVSFQRKVLEGLFSLADADPAIAAKSADDLLAAVLDWKSMSGRTLLARQEALMLERDPQAIRLYDELREVRQQLAQLQLDSAQRDAESRRQTLKAHSEKLERELAGRVQSYATLRSSSEAGPDALGRHMPPGSVLVEFTRYNQYRFADNEKDLWSGSRYAAIIYQPLSRKTWITDFERAEAESNRLGKPLLVHFVSDWDPYTRKMDAEVVYEPEFQQMMDQFVAVRVDVGRFNQNAALSTRFKIRAIPTDVLVSPDGRELGRLQGSRTKEKYIEGIRTTFKISPQGGGPRLVLLGDAEPIDQAIQQWRRSVDTRRVDARIEQTLHDLVWKPIEDSLFRDASRLFIAPDGELALVPFEAIRLPDDRYLIEKYHVSYLSNGRELMPRLTPPGEPGPAVVVSDPAYDLLDGNDRQPADTLLASTGQTRSQLVETRGMTFQSLPGFSREASAVADTWRQSGTPEPLTLIAGADAVEESLFQLHRPRFLHLVTHGFFFSDLAAVRGLSPADLSTDATVPSPEAGVDERGLAKVRRKPTETKPGAVEDARLRSGLALAGANRWRQRSRAGLSDGLLTAMEVENLNLWGTELVVLSACETGLGEVQVGEGVMGLRRAFQQAGARTVMSSLWKVPDAETEQLMSRFFQLWLAGSDKSAALRTAQLELIARLRTEPNANRNQSPPFYWAAFVCHGAQ